jgi:hypothetical protein
MLAETEVKLRINDVLQPAHERALFPSPEEPSVEPYTHGMCFTTYPFEFDGTKSLEITLPDGQKALVLDNHGILFGRTFVQLEGRWEEIKPDGQKEPMIIYNGGIIRLPDGVLVRDGKIYA